MAPKFKRILLKLSGESLMGDKNFGLDSTVISRYAQDIKSIVELGVQVAIVIGGGNIYRGMNEAETGIKERMATTWACSPPSSMAWPSRPGWKRSAYTHACKALSRWNRSRNPTSAEGPSGTWKKV